MDTTELQARLNYLQQKKYNETTEENIKTNHSTFKCEKCQDKGVIIRIVEGDVFAKNCECTERAILENKVKFASIPEEFKDVKVDSYKPNKYTNQEAMRLATCAKEMIKNYILGYEEYKSEGVGLYLYSDTKGSGKTMLSIALGNALITLYKENVKFITTIDLLNEIKKTYAKDSDKKDSDLLNTIKKINVLILDDIGTEKQSEWLNEILYQIFNYRMTSKLVTIFTSNTHYTKLKHDERIKSRIEAMVVPVQMPEQSIRKQLAQTRNEVIAKKLLNL